VSNAIIKVQGLSKRYVIGHQANGDGLRHAIEGALRNPLKWLKKRSMEKEEFWALNNISFEVKPGQVMGFIGRNGAGKSTLLKILSRISEPTSGRIEIDGRVASLLEVGTGFHPELTGRENIFLNGAILGMTRVEIKRKFDEIVAFSEVEKFLDTPVKRYSSGMYVRLAFAVAAHLEPEILIVDEVLAVGDAEFQRKCLGKMQDVSTKEGRTVLFVSHNMAAVRQLCTEVTLIAKGEIAFQGGVREGVARYLMDNAANKSGWKRQTPMPTEPGIYFRDVSVQNERGEATELFEPSENIRVAMELFANGSFSRPQISLRFTNAEGVPAFCTCSTDYAGKFEPFEPGVHRFIVEMPAGLLMPGRYSLHLGSHLPRDRAFDQIDHELSLEVTSIGSTATVFGDNRPGVVVPVFQWRRI